jgi:hypothetical protein
MSIVGVCGYNKLNKFKEEKNVFADVVSVGHWLNLWFNLNIPKGEAFVMLSTANNNWLIFQLL